MTSLDSEFVETSLSEGICYLAEVEEKFRHLRIERTIVVGVVFRCVPVQPAENCHDCERSECRKEESNVTTEYRRREMVQKRLALSLPRQGKQFDAQHIARYYKEKCHHSNPASYQTNDR